MTKSRVIFTGTALLVMQFCLGVNPIFAGSILTSSSDAESAVSSGTENLPGLPDLPDMLHPQGVHYRILCRDRMLPSLFEEQMEGYKTDGTIIRENASRVTRLTGNIGDIEVDWTILNTTEGEYADFLDDLLSRQDELQPEDRLDLFEVSTDMLSKYCQDGQEVALTTAETGLTESDLVSQYKPLRTLATGEDGAQRAVTPSLPVMVWAYRRSIAKSVIGTDDPSKVASAVEDWDAFEQTAEKMKKAGYRMYSSWTELYDISASGAESPWVNSQNVLSFDDSIVRWIHRTKSDAESGYVHGTERGSDEWLADMRKDSDVFGFCLTPAEMVQCLTGTDSGKEGDWAVAGGPGTALDGASWLLASKGTDNTELTKRVMQTLTTGADSMTALLEQTETAVNNRDVMENASEDRTLSCAFLGGQNPYGIYRDAAEKISVSNRTDYDDGLKQILTDEYLPYFKGEADEQTALENFYKAALSRYPDLLT